MNFQPIPFSYQDYIECDGFATIAVCGILGLLDFVLNFGINNHHQTLVRLPQYSE